MTLDEQRQHAKWAVDRLDQLKKKYKFEIIDTEFPDEVYCMDREIETVIAFIETKSEKLLKILWSSELSFLGRRVVHRPNTKPISKRKKFFSRS